MQRGGSEKPMEMEEEGTEEKEIIQRIESMFEFVCVYFTK